MRVDVDNILKSKNPKLYRKLPRFIISLIKRIIHQNDVNEMLDKCKGLTGIPFVTAALNHLGIKRIAKGLEYVDPSGEYIFVANHPLGGLDGMALIETIGDKFESPRALVNDILMNIEPMQELFLPVNKHGRQSSSYANLIADHFISGKALVSFPAGFCSRWIDGEVRDTAWNKNYIHKALNYKRTIVPVFVDEINSPLFYRVERLRKFLGVKMNIGMILLPHELFRRSKRKGEVKMIFGEPIPYEELMTESVSYWNGEIRRRCYSLNEKQK